MKIKLIVKLSIIFCTATLFGADKEQIIKKVVSYTGSQQKPSTEYILNTFKDKRLQIDSAVLERFKNKLITSGPPIEFEMRVPMK